MTTRKHKPAPAAAAAKKRPSAQASKPVKTVAAEKIAAVASVAREKERTKPTLAPKKAAGDTNHIKAAEVKTPVETTAHSPEAKSAPAVEAKAEGAKSAIEKTV